MEKVTLNLAHRFKEFKRLSKPRLRLQYKILLMSSLLLTGYMYRSSITYFKPVPLHLQNPIPKKNNCPQ
jgi:hypothetical protein